MLSLLYVFIILVDHYRCMLSGSPDQVQEARARIEELIDSVMVGSLHAITYSLNFLSNISQLKIYIYIILIILIVKRIK